MIAWALAIDLSASKDSFASTSVEMRPGTIARKLRAEPDGQLVSDYRYRVVGGSAFGDRATDVHRP